jgi:4-amino-4-deoxy-L-arabinose transferase-like glycosyltransferase
LEVLGLVLLAGWLVGVHLAHPAMLDPDEPRTAIIMRLMAERGDWLVPRLPQVFHCDYPHDPLEGDTFAYWDKPPLGFWLGAAAMKVFGPTALAARLPTGLAHVATVLLVYLAGRSLAGLATASPWRAGPRAGFLAGAIMATAPLSLVIAHLARVDALLVALMTAMLVAVLRLVGGTARPWIWTLVLYVAAGLGLLTKGLEAVAIPALAVFATAAITGRWRDLARLRPLAGAAICLAIALPWFLSMHLRYPVAADGQGPGFLYEFFVRQHFGRATTGEFGHAGHVPGYLLGAMLLGFLPWTIFLPGACVEAGRAAWRQRREHPAIVLLMAWALVVLVLFSLSKTSMVHYVAPAFPALAVLAGVYLSGRIGAPEAGGWFRLGLAVTLALGAAVVAGTVIYLVRSDLWHKVFAWGVAIPAGIAVAGAVCVLRRRYSGAVALLVAGVVVVETFILTADPFQVYRVNTTRLEAGIIRKTLRPDDALIAYPYTPYSLAWYFWPREIPYPAVGGPGSEQPSFPALVEALNQPQRTFCVLQKRSVLDALRPQVGRPIRVLSEMHDHTLIVTEPPPSTGPYGQEGPNP